MKADKSLWVLLLALVLVGCEQTITLDLPDFEQKLAIESIIESEDFAGVAISRNEERLGYVNDLDTFTHITNALVELTTELGSQICTYEFSNNDRSFYACTEPIAASGKMSLRVEDQGDVVTAETEVPSTASIATADVEEQETSFYGETFIEFFFDVTIDDLANEDNFYQLGYSFAITPEDQILDSPNFEGDLFYTDVGRDGQEISIRERINSFSFFAPEGETVYVSVFVMSLSESAYNYFSSQQAQENQGDFQGPFSEPTPINGNINNGLGVFGVRTTSEPFQISFTP